MIESGQDPTNVFREAMAASPRVLPFRWAVPADVFVKQGTSEIQWVVPNLIPESALALVVGPSNVGKTWFLLDLIWRAIANGKRALLIEEEGGRNSLRKRLQLLGLVNPALTIVHREGVRLDDPLWANKLRGIRVGSEAGPRGSGQQRG